MDAGRSDATGPGTKRAHGGVRGQSQDSAFGVGPFFSRSSFSVSQGLGGLGASWGLLGPLGASWGLLGPLGVGLLGEFFLSGDLESFEKNRS